MDELDQSFNNAVELVNQRKLKNTPNDDELSSLYKYFKQATIGDINISCPLLDLKGRVKWFAWDSIKGMSSKEAKEKYIETVLELFQKYN
tara:strand:+ start:318 stop:587 length:270 start_codon:yes stop_codon:yes gene_type:complete